ncbi:hypothetical protein [Denitromonas iodatirespirans]|uniref:Outer membrane protein assembly factor BamE n=1 Tax=Denitromonas iodatirespirans TaxID=2795389 RepID=A0A944DC65_DENI1|nr:hypothetical protein [Denitromonas iodatirespirans]MBT0962346.1 hypothetical protein [Denitromonas iodatirespirans]
MKRGWMLVVVLWLAGCALMPPIVPGQSAAQVRAEQGAPTRILPQADGGELWQYATQPFGTTFIQVKFDAAGQVVDTWDGLAADRLAQIQPGMTLDEVQQRLGPQRSVERFALSGETVYDWNISNSGNPGTATFFNVHFRDDRVVRTSTTYQFPRDGSFFGGFGIHGGSGMGVGINIGIGVR